MTNRRHRRGGARPARRVAASLLAASALGASLLGASLLGAPVLGAPVLGAPVLGAPALAAPLLGASALAASPLAAPLPGASALAASPLAAPALAASPLAAPVLARQQDPSPDPIAVSAELRALRSQATDPDRAIEAVLALTAILDTLDARRDANGRLPEIEAELFLKALEYRARAHLVRGARDEAADDLRILVLADPARRLDLTELSPAVLDLFEEQRGELLAYLTVITEPPGVTVLVRDDPVGETPLVARPVFAGLLDIRLERPGYAAVEESRREVLAGEIVEIEREMERTGPVLSVITAPPGVTVRVGGRVVGTTGGSLPDGLRPLAPPRFAAEEFSAPLAIGSLRTGANEITLEAPCRRPSRFTFHADEARDYLPRFVRLRPSTGGLRIESEPSGGTVLLDGEERGVTPLSFSAMCSGDHRVEIRHPAGRCARSFRVSRGARTAIRCEVFPVLALTPSAPVLESAVDLAVARMLREKDGFYFVEDADEEGFQAQVRVVIPEPGAGPSRMEFFAAGSRVPDTARFDRFAPGTAVTAVEELLSPPVRRRSWLGLTATVRRISSDGGRGRTLEVTSVHPAGPAVLAGVETGDELREMEGRSLSDELGIAEIVATAEPGATLDMLVRREGADRLLRVTLAETPVLPSLGAGRCNRRLVALEADFARGHREPTRQLEAAICRILLGDPAHALLEHLNELPHPAPRGGG